jgi:hypothetical protein
MATSDRPNDARTQGTGPDLAAHARGMSPPLSEQTPGLDRTRRVRNVAMRPVSYARERPAVVMSIVGGLVVLGIGTWLAMRSRRPSRMELLRDKGVYLRDKGSELIDWLRSQL